MMRYLSSTSIHGLPQAVNATSLNQRIFWFTLFLGGVFGFSVNLYFLSIHFCSGPILTQIYREFDDFVWPHLTVCNPTNPIAFWNRSHLRSKWSSVMQLTQNLSRIPYPGIRGRVITPQMIGMSTINPIEFFHDSVTEAVQGVRVYVDSDNIFVSSGDLDQFTRIPPQEFHKVFDIRYESSRLPLPCYTLKPETLAKFKKIGSVQRIMRIKMHVFMDHASYNFFNSGQESRKMYFYISYPNATLQRSMLYFLYTGTTSHFHLTESQVKRIKGCTDEIFTVDLFDIDFSSWRRYRGNYDDCRMQESQRLFVNACDCYNPLLPIYRFGETTPRLCFNLTLFSVQEVRQNIRCLLRVQNKYSAGDTFKKLVAKNCSRYNKPSCFNYYYSVVRSSNYMAKQLNPLRTKLIEEALPGLPNFLKNSTKDFVHSNFASIVLYRTEPKTALTVEEFEYPLSRFVSDIGGIMGLWLGLSVISVFEFVCISMRIIEFACYRQR